MNEDEEIWEHLRRNGFEERQWQAVSTRLARYGYQVIGAWIRDRTIFARCSREGAHGPGNVGPLFRMSPEDLEELVQDTVASGLVGLRRRAVDGITWQPEGGRSLRSYFVTACLFAFPAVYRTHCRNHRRWEPRNDVLAEPGERVPDIAESIADRDHARRLLHEIDDVDLRSAVYLSAHRYTHAEIAAVLGHGTTVKRVERMLSRYRDRVRSQEQADKDVREEGGRQ